MRRRSMRQWCPVPQAYESCGFFKKQKASTPRRELPEGWHKTLPFISASEEQFAFLKLGLRSCQKLAQCVREVCYEPTNITHGKCVKNIFQLVGLIDGSIQYMSWRHQAIRQLHQLVRSCCRSSPVQLVHETAFLDIAEKRVVNKTRTWGSVVSDA